MITEPIKQIEEREEVLNYIRRSLPFLSITVLLEILATVKKAARDQIWEPK
jgi:hypothetical protein